MILSEPSNPWIVGASNLFTAEFYRIASRKLAPSGIFAQWIQTYSFSPDDYAMVIRTMANVFPYQRLLRISQNDTILLGGNASLDVDAAVVEASQRLVAQSPDVQFDLQRYFGSTDVASLLLTYVFLDESALGALVAADTSGRFNLDRDLQLEFRAARHMFERREVNVGGSILSAVRPGWFDSQYRRLGCDARHSAAVHELITQFLNANLKKAVAGLAQLGLIKDPGSTQLLADQLIMEERVDSDILDRLLESSDASAAMEANRVGVVYWKEKRFADAIVVFDRMSQRYPYASNVWTNLAINYEKAGNFEAAERAHRRALELDPTNYFTQKEFGSFSASGKAETSRAGQ